MQHRAKGIISELIEWFDYCLYQIDAVDKPEQDVDFEGELNKIIITIGTLEQLGSSIPKELLERRDKLENAGDALSVLKEVVDQLQEMAKVGHDKLREHGVRRQRQEVKRETARGSRNLWDLSVTMPDGREICCNRATDTFVEVLKLIGLNRITELRQLVEFGHPLVSRQSNANGKAQRIVDGYYIQTHSSTPSKARTLERIAEYLNEDIIVKLAEP